MPSNAAPIPVGSRPSPGTETDVKPGFNLLRRDSGFSIANLAASLPMGGRARSTGGEESGQQLITVSRPSSLRSKSSWQDRTEGDESQDEDERYDDGSESVTTGDENGDENYEGGGGGHDPETVGDTKRLRSFENMLSASKERGKEVRPRKKSISDRLASVSALVTSKVKWLVLEWR